MNIYVNGLISIIGNGGGAMPRPAKQTVEYFPHFVYDSRTKSILENDWGNDGYAFWFKLLELLCKSDGHYYDCNSKVNWKHLLSICKVDSDKANGILNELVELEKIDSELWEHRIIWCQTLVDNLKQVYSKRKTNVPTKPDVSGNKSVNNEDDKGFSYRKPKLNRVSNSDNPQSKVKYSKVKDVVVEDNTRVRAREKTEELQNAVSASSEEHKTMPLAAPIMVEPEYKTMPLAIQENLSEEDKFIRAVSEQYEELTRRFVAPGDYPEITKLARLTLDSESVCESMRNTFNMWKPKHNLDQIRSIKYFIPAIYDAIEVKRKIQEVKQSGYDTGNGESHGESRKFSRSEKDRNKSARSTNPLKGFRRG